MSLIPFYNPETKRQSSQWKSRSSLVPEKARVQKSAGHLMLVAFFDIHGIIYYHLVPQGKTINGEYFAFILKEMLRKVKRKRPELISNGFKLHMDNASPHRAKIVSKFIHKNNIELLPHAPYSPDVAPCDFFFFPILKTN